MSKHAGTVVLEVGLNERAEKAQNPNVPYGPDEVAADLVACMSHGATLVHYHARYDDGQQGWNDAALSRRALDAAAARVDLIAYPSYVGGDLTHVFDLADHPGTHRLRISPFDPPQHGVGGSFENGDETHAPAKPLALDELSRRGIVPNVAAFNVGDLQWSIAATRAGHLAQPLNVKLFLSETITRMNRADVPTLEHLASMLPPDIDCETVVVPYEIRDLATIVALLRRALELGLGIRVGLGDNPEVWTTQTNAELVDWGRALCAEYDLAPATPQAFRERCGIGHDA